MKNCAYDELLEDSLTTEDLLRLEREHRVVTLQRYHREWRDDLIGRPNGEGETC